MLQVRVSGRPFAAIGAARKRDMQVLIDVPTRLGFRYTRVEPAPWALLRACSANKVNRVALRLLVQGKSLIAMLVTGQHPLLWRTMELVDDEAWDLVVSMVRTFESYANQHL